jgi:hypothetical protein
MATVLTWTNAGGVRVAVTLDAAERQSFESTAEPAEHAVERGPNVSDHVKQNGDTFTVEGVVSNTPILDDGRAGSARGSVQPLTLMVGGVPVTLSTLQWSQAFDRAKFVDGLLLAAKEAGALVTYTTSLREVPDCIVTRYRVDRDAATGNALALALTLQRLRLVNVRRVEVPDPAQRRGQQTRQRGSQPAQTPAAARRSALTN